MSRHFLNELRAAFASDGGRPAVVFRDAAITYGAVDQMARRAAGWFQQLGVAPGDRVALYTADKIPFLAAHLGALYAGAAPIPLNPRFTREEMRFFLSDSRARAIVVGGEQRAGIEELAAELNHRVDVVAGERILDPPGAAFREPAVAADDPCLMLYSSGTTGWPKGVVHTHAGAAGSVRALQSCWRIDRDDVVVNVLPLFHIHGLAFATHTTWLAGGCVWIEESFELERAYRAIGRGTVLMAVPPIYYRFLADPAFRPRAKTWSHVRLFTCGSAPIRAEVLPDLQDILNRPVINRYGMTEAYVITSLPLDGPWPTGSVGLPLEAIERKVTRDDGSPAGVAEVGAVWIRGPNLFREYWGRPDATRAAFTDGWFDTGDLGSLDDAGFLTLVGRKNDLIITSGYNVYPQVVERVVGECPGVGECAVFGVADAQRGERVVAAIVRSDAELTETRLLARLQDRLVYYQQPRSIVFLDSLPKNSLGKVLRRQLKDEFPGPKDED